MNISRKWLKEYTPVEVSDHEFDAAMTMSGTKVETTEVLSAEIRNVVVGKVLEIRRHENSDHMWICQVDVGEAEPVQIVTGAQNVKQGDLCPVAKHNSYLPGGIHITKGKLRGEKSYGMLCSLKELGLTVNDFPYAIEDGIFIIEEPDAYVGQDINEVIGTDDSVVEFEITNNRTDCYSIIGIAREAAATFQKPLTLHEPQVKGSAAGSIFDELEIEIADPDLCPRYTEDDGETWHDLCDDDIVSMNLWGFHKSYLEEAWAGFPAFLDKALAENPLKGEYYLPTVVANLLSAKKARVKVLRSDDKWYGVTYKEDKPMVVAALAGLRNKGLYPQNLWEE
jgi:tRNA-binding EMAP/Myf-like protein